MRMSPSAYWLFQCMQDGLAPEEITDLVRVRFGQQASVPAIARACDAVRARVQQEAQSSRARERRRYTLRIRLLGEGPVGRIAGCLEPLTSRLAALAYGSLMVTAAAAMIFSHPFRGAYAHLSAAGGLVTAYALYLLALCAHELGHATACSRYRLRPGDIGFAVYLVFPAVYCDVTRVWLLPRRQRVLVDVAGLLFETALGAAYVIGAAVTGSWVLGLAAIMVAGNMLWVLNPFGRFDLYWAISDALGITDLRRESARAVRDLVRPRTPRDTVPGHGRATRLALAAYAAAATAVAGWFGYTMLRSVPYLLTHLRGTAALAARAVERGQAGTALTAAVRLVLPALIFAMLYYRLAGLAAPAVRLLARRLAHRARQPGRALAEDEDG